VGHLAEDVRSPASWLIENSHYHLRVYSPLRPEGIFRIMYLLS
jgi:hypothetical protein